MKRLEATIKNLDKIAEEIRKLNEFEANALAEKDRLINEGRTDSERDIDRLSRCTMRLALVPRDRARLDKETSAILAEIEDVVVDEVNVWNNFINTTLANSEENLIKAVLPWFMGSERKVRQFLNPERDRALTIPLLCKFELARYEKLDVKVARRGGIEGWQRAARYFEDHVDTCCRVLGLRELFAEHVAANAEKVEKLKGMIGELKNANAELEGALEKIQKS